MAATLADGRGSGASWVRAARAGSARIGCLAALAAYLLVGGGYTAAVPPWEAPDEPAHAAYAEAWAAGRSAVGATYEAHQPPVYYAFLGALVKVLGAPLARSPANPYYPFAAAAFLHPPEEAALGPIAVVRTVSGFVGLLAVALAWATARRLAPGRPLTAALAGFTVALLPQFQFVAHSLSNDGAATAAGALLVYLAARVARSGPRAVSVPAMAAAAALACLTKATVWPMALPMACALAITARPRDDRAAALTRAGAAVAGVGLALAALAAWAPALAAALGADAARRGTGLDSALLSPPILATLFVNTGLSFWGRFGWLTVDLPPATAVLAALCAAWGAAGALVAVRRGGAADRRVAALLALAVVAAWLAWGRNLLADPQPQGRLMFPALPAASALLALGWLAALPARGRPAAATLVIAFLALVNVAALTRALPDAMAPARIASPTVVAGFVPGEHVVAARLKGEGAVARQSLRLAGGPVTSAAVVVARATGGGDLRLRLLAPGGEAVAERRVALEDLPDGAWLAAPARLPGGDVAPGQYELEAEIVRGRGEVRLFGGREAPADGAGTLEVNGRPGTRLVFLVLGPPAREP